jgi:hypothetical protein
LETRGFLCSSFIYEIFVSSFLKNPMHMHYTARKIEHEIGLCLGIASCHGSGLVAELELLCAACPYFSFA